MIELLQGAAARDWDHLAVTGASEVRYGDLLDRAVAIADGLRARGIHRVAGVLRDLPDALALLGGGSLAGIEVCLYDVDAAPQAVADLAERFGHATIVTSREDLGGSVEVLSIADLVASAGEGGPVGRPEPASRPLLVLTTGTTGLPKGVQHDWGRLLSGAVRGTPPTPDARWLFAYGLHQFAAFQLLIHVLASHATLVVPESNRPAVAARVAIDHEVDHISATPTFWRFLLAELRAAGTLPPLRQITLGGEAVPDHLVQTLASTFPEARISQIYAASEFGQSGSVRDGRAGLPISVLERDEDSDVCFRVEDGELWVRSRVGMLGYYGEPPVDPDAWRPTGDLVEIVGDRIEFRGRTSEVINVGGVKVHPLPIEELVSTVPGVRVARVFGRPNALTGNIVAVEVVMDPSEDEEVVRERIREACADLPGASAPRSIRFVDEVSTAGGKIVRREGT